VRGSLAQVWLKWLGPVCFNHVGLWWPITSKSCQLIKQSSVWSYRFISLCSLSISILNHQEPVPFSFQETKAGTRFKSNVGDIKVSVFFRISHTRRNLNTKARHRISLVFVVYSFHIIVPALYTVAAYALQSIHNIYRQQYATVARATWVARATIVALTVWANTIHD